MSTNRIATLEALLARLEDPGAYGRAIGEDVMWNVAKGICDTGLFPAERLQDAIALLEAALPTWWWTVGRCGLTGHASIGPDYAGPHGDWVRQQFPEEIYDAGFDADLAPGDGIERVCRALLHCIVQAYIAIAEEGAADG